MNKLYVLLVILIATYIAINAAAGNLDLLGSDTNSTDTDTNNKDSDNISLGSSNFEKLDNFKSKKINDTALKLKDSKNTTIIVQQIDNSQNISDIANKLISTGDYTSNQVIDQNGVTSYFLYKEGTESYDADIFFNKDDQNYELSGDHIDYANSDNFINSCKNIIDTMSSSGSSKPLIGW